MTWMVVGCSTSIKLDKPEIIREALKEEDIVKVESISNQEYTFKITKIDDSALYGQDVTLAFEDIRKLEKKMTAEKRVTGVVLLTVIIAMLIEIPELGIVFFAL